MSLSSSCWVEWSMIKDPFGSIWIGGDDRSGKEKESAVDVVIMYCIIIVIESIASILVFLHQKRLEIETDVAPAIYFE